MLIPSHIVSIIICKYFVSSLIYRSMVWNIKFVFDEIIWIKLRYQKKKIYIYIYILKYENSKTIVVVFVMIYWNSWRNKSRTK
jgi:hypothetical protein